MSEARLEAAEETQKSFMMEVKTIPDGVDTGLANLAWAIIDLYVGGHLDKELAMANLQGLYWDAQESANPETRHYLLDLANQFAVESGIPTERAQQIFGDSLDGDEDE